MFLGELTDARQLLAALHVELPALEHVVDGESLDRGGLGDAHAGDWHRQISLLAVESIEKARQMGLDVTFGDFAENIATIGIDWVKIPVGTRFKLGRTAVVEITQIGKECKKRRMLW